MRARGERRVLFSLVSSYPIWRSCRISALMQRLQNLTKWCGQGPTQYSVMERVALPFCCWEEPRGGEKGNVPAVEFLPTGYAAHLCYHPRCLKKEGRRVSCSFREAFYTQLLNSTPFKPFISENHRFLKVSYGKEK